MIAMDLKVIWKMAVMSNSSRQRAHYERLIDLYEIHYFDKWSSAYREEFIYEPAWGGLDLHGKSIAELACASGQNSKALLDQFPSARITGYDISPTACKKYRLITSRPAIVTDLTKPGNFTPEYDMVFVIGGLHHCVADLPQTLQNVATMLKPDGVFIMLEPNSLHLLERLRKFWYRMDANFDAETEHALDHDSILSDDFSLIDIRYLGGPAYFFVLNSMITRVPLWLKPHISPALLRLERLWNKARWPRLHNVFLARWRRC